MKYFKKICRVLMIAAFWIFVWGLASFFFANELLFPSPLTVLQALWELLGTAEFYRATLRSLTNILTGLLIAITGATVTAFLTHSIPLLRELLTPLMTVVKATPVASFIILALIFIGAASVPVFISVLIVFPVVWTNLDEGLSKIDPHLSELATVYRFSYAKRLRFLILPSVKPYFLSACRTSLGLAWKAGIAAEILAMPPATIGTEIADAKAYIEVPEMFAWTLTVILLSLLIEFSLVALIERLGKENTEKREV